MLLIDDEADNASVKDVYKRQSMKWSNRNRFQKGLIYPVWSLLGYVRDEDRKWAIEPHGAEIVQNIFALYLEGYSSPRIADILNLCLLYTSQRRQVPGCHGKLLYPA